MQENDQPVDVVAIMSEIRESIRRKRQQGIYTDEESQSLALQRLRSAAQEAQIDPLLVDALMGPSHDWNIDAGYAIRTTLRFAGRNLRQMLGGSWYRFGYACVNFGRPVSARAWLTQHAAQFGGDLRPLTRERRFEAVGLLAHELMFFSRGQPVIYSGDEQGFTGDGGDRAARQDMFASRTTSYLDDDLLGTDRTHAVDNYNTAHPVYQQIARLGELRRQHRALRDGVQVSRYAADGPGIFAFSRTDPGEKVEYVVAANNATTAQTAAPPGASERGHAETRRGAATAVSRR